jgi:branched-chain amino acid transport system substrate-binding protein
MNQPKRTNLLSLISFLCIFVVATFYFPISAKSEKAVKSSPLKIAALLCLSGDCAEWGTNALRGAELAVEQINQSGGVLGQKIELVVQDSSDTSPAKALTALKQILFDSEIKYIVGPTWTVAGMVLIPAIKQRPDVIVTSPSVGLKDFNESSENIFNVWPHDEIATRRLASYAIEHGWKTAGIFGSQDPWVTAQSDVFAEAFGAAGGKVVVRVEPLPSARDLRVEAAKIAAAKPEVVFFSNYQADEIAKHFHELKFEAPKLSILMEKNRVKSANGALEGTVFALYQAASSEFQKAFKQKFNVEPGITADTAYDVVMLYSEVIKAQNSASTSETLPALLQTKNYQGASGTFSIDSNGAVNKRPVLWKVKGENYLELGQ